MLHKFVSIQPDLKSGFYLRLNDNDELITEYPQKTEIFDKVGEFSQSLAYYLLSIQDISGAWLKSELIGL